MSDQPKWKKGGRPPIFDRMIKILTKVKDGLEGELQRTQAELDERRGAHEVKEADDG